MQQNQCFNFALKEGYNVSGIYIDDGYTAKNTNRPKFQQLLTDIKSKKSNINAVIVWRCDRMVRIDGKKIIIPDKEKAPYIREVFQLYIDGFSYKEIALNLAKKGFTHNNKPCSRKLVENILTVYDIFYIGKFKFKGEIYAGKHEPIISLEKYSEFKTMRESRFITKSTKHNFLYKGMILCLKKERMFVGELQNGKHKSGEYKYYRCHHKCEFYNNCKRIIKEEMIDKSIIETFSTLSMIKEQFQELRTDLKAIMYKNQEMNEQRKSQIEIQLKKLENRLLALYDDKIDGLISQEIYTRKRDCWQNQIDDLSIELAALNKTNAEIFERIENMLELCKDLTGAYLRQPDHKKRILIKLLCSNLFYDGSKLM